MTDTAPTKPVAPVSSPSPYVVFLLSPANLSGKRAAMIFNPRAQFDVAVRLRSAAGAPVGDVFSFVSGLYFRGKKAYAEAFGRPPQGLAPGLVISPAEGLRSLQEHVTVDRLRAWVDVDVDAGNDTFTRPLLKHAEMLERAHGSETRFVLLGSVATTKYVRPLTMVFGDHLWFPPDFVGRGDMSRGALLLHAVRANQELHYAPVENSRLSTRGTGTARRGANQQPRPEQDE
jgi:hypothetical protein